MFPKVMIILTSLLAVWNLVGLRTADTAGEIIFYLVLVAINIFTMVIFMVQGDDWDIK